MKKYILILCLFWAACSSPSADVVLETEAGEIHIELFDHTPQHKANFLKLAEEGFYEEIPFYRVMEGFMVQAGGSAVGKTSAETLDAEIHREYMHIAGAVSAAAKAAFENPERKSSGNEFFIVTGKTLLADDIEQAEKMVNERLNARLTRQFEAENPHFAPLKADSSGLSEDSLTTLYQMYTQERAAYGKAHLQEFQYTDEQREAYGRIGGASHLDMDHTVFGRVLKGMDIVSQIEASETEGQRAIKPIRILKVRVNE